MSTERPPDVDADRTARRNAAGADATDPSDSRLRRAVAKLLRVPLFYKILLANAGTVAVLASLATWLTAVHGLGRFGPLGPAGGALLVGGVAGGASLLLHVFLLRRALSPLRELASVAARLMEEGPDSDLDLRARIPVTADRSLADVIRVFNGMLESLSTYRSQLRRLTARTLEAAEEDRKQIAAHLQEDTAQRLASLMVRLQLLRRIPDPERRDDFLRELREQLSQSLESVRRLARRLHPPELGDLGLEGALRAFVRSLADGDRGPFPRVELDLEPADEELDEGARVALYRILQEALRNAHLHSGAERIEVEARRRADRLSVTVRDDGRGLDRDGSKARSESLGLLMMRERALHAGGSFSVAGRPGLGTTVRVELPLPPRGAAAAGVERAERSHES